MENDFSKCPKCGSEICTSWLNDKHLSIACIDQKRCGYGVVVTATDIIRLTAERDELKRIVDGLHSLGFYALYFNLDGWRVQGPSKLYGPCKTIAEALELAGCVEAKRAEAGE